MFDEVNSVTVNVGLGTLSSVTRAALLGDQTINAYAIGVDGRWELGQFRDAALVSAGIYTLTGLLRGGRGTEHAMTGHTSSETFVLLRPAGMRRVSMESTLLGIDRYYRCVSINRLLASATTRTFSNDGVGLMPFSPFDVRAARNAGDITFTWQRRSRLATRTTGALGISIPLGEASESYSIDVFSDGTYTTVLRTLTSSTTSVAYSAAQQTTDFGSPQTTVYVAVHQVSEVVGRGYPEQAAA